MIKKTSRFNKSKNKLTKPLNVKKSKTKTWLKKTEIKFLKKRL